MMKEFFNSVIAFLNQPFMIGFSVCLFTLFGTYEVVRIYNILTANKHNAIYIDKDTDDRLRYIFNRYKMHLKEDSYVKASYIENIDYNHFVDMYVKHLIYQDYYNELSECGENE